MERVPQSDAVVERARRNHEEIIRLLESEKRESEFLEIGRLLKQCKEQQHFRALNYPSFRQYVEKELRSSNVSYAHATRYIGVYELMDRPDGPPRRTLQDVGMAKAFLLLPKAKRGEVTLADWEAAAGLTFGDLLRARQRDERLGKPSLVRGRESPRHRGIQKKIQEIGASLGKYAQIEYRVSLGSPSKEWKYDVVWKTYERALGVTHVFEVCLDGGSIDHDMTKLGYAYRTLGLPRLFLIVAKPEDVSLARSCASGDMARNLEVLEARTIQQLHEELWQPTIWDFIDLFMR
jgi:hypothetical protein